MISTCLGSLGCHNLEFIMANVSDLLFLLHRKGQAHFWRKEAKQSLHSSASLHTLSDFDLANGDLHRSHGQFLSIRV